MQNTPVKDDTKMVAMRDPFGTYHTKLEALCENYKRTNPDSLAPDELSRVKKSWMLRYLIDKAAKALTNG